MLCCVALLLPLCGVAQTKHKGAHLKLLQTSCNFGEVSRRGENQRCTVSFTNDGTEPLVLFAAITSCSCLKVNFSRKPVPVGAKGEIELLVDVKKMDKGIFHRVVQLRSNSVGGTENLMVEGRAKD